MRDLRWFLRHLDESDATSFVRVHQPLSTYLEVSVLQQKLAHSGRYPVVLLESVSESRLPLVTNLFASYDSLARALDLDSVKGLLPRFVTRQTQSMPPTVVSAGKAPVQEEVMLGEDVDLEALPITHHAVLDSGRYITAGCMVCRDPDSGTYNVGIYRHELQGPRTLGAMFSPYQDAAHILRRHRELGRAMEVAIFIGHHPAVAIGALSVGPVTTHSEYDVIGGLLGESLEVVKGESVDLMVPARAEIVIEGVIDPNTETSDGPFAEFTGYYGGRKTAASIDVTAVTRRKDAIYHDLDPAHREHNLVGALPLEAALHDSIQARTKALRDVCVPISGSCFFSAYVSINNISEGLAMQAGLAALATHANLKHVVVVDSDIDVRNEEQVQWAINTRFNAARDLAIIPNATGGNLDPVAYGADGFTPGPMSTKLILDATQPLSRSFPTRITPSPEIWERISLEDLALE
ncbi:MAG: UbiD family decarboxylase [Acidimicrobiia bacterium]